jgi:hypothetical protein
MAHDLPISNFKRAMVKSSLIAGFHGPMVSCAQKCRSRPIRADRVCTGRQELETGRGVFDTLIAEQAFGQLVAQRMKVKHVGRRIFQLGLRQGFGRPVGLLLRLRDIDVQQLSQIVLEAVSIRIGPHEPRCDLGAEDRRGRNPERVKQNRNIEASVVKDFLSGGIGKQCDEIGSVFLPIRMTSAVPSPGDSCTTQSLSRRGTRPSVSVSIATAPV